MFGTPPLSGRLRASLPRSLAINTVSSPGQPAFPSTLPATVYWASFIFMSFVCFSFLQCDIESGDEKVSALQFTVLLFAPSRLSAFVFASVFAGEGRMGWGVGWGVFVSVSVVVAWCSGGVSVSV